jgi:hypothetical protein
MECKELPRFYIILAGGRGDPVRDVSTVSESPEIETGRCHVPWAIHSNIACDDITTSSSLLVTK